MDKIANSKTVTSRVAERRAARSLDVAYRDAVDIAVVGGAGAARAYQSAAQRWTAVQQRDALADEVFWYSVRSTGVYCRPSCGARPALRQNVAFHESRADAEQAGFRPCLRCKPDQPALAARQAALVAEACRLIDLADTAPDLDTLAAAVGLSRFHFHRIFKAVTGITPRAYASALRARRVQQALLEAGGTALASAGTGAGAAAKASVKAAAKKGAVIGGPGAASVTDALYAAGYNSSGRFYAQAQAVLGMTPGAYRAGGRGAQIRFAIAQCSLGAILVASTAQGICAILIDDDPAFLLRDLQDRFPAAELLGAEAEYEQVVARVIGLVEQPAQGCDLPLDVQGTAFQQRVWQVLREIPPGQTVSYAQLAQRVGLPRGARAVASACAANALAVAIPCHRVVRQDGSLSGYRWGVERKAVLLEREAEQ